ncbi:MAG TPA: collagen-like protein, partial [Allocoleopsis sp.]
NEYREFVERLDGSFRLVWQESRSLNDFAGQTATLQLNDNKRIQVTFPQGIWVQGTESQQGKQTTYVVNHIIQAKEATQLKVADFSGQSTTLNLAVVDLAGKSDLLNTQFRLKYRAADSRDRFGSSDFKTRYEGTIPADLVTRDYNRFTLAVGKLPINGAYLGSGTNVELELVATRSLGDHSAEQTIRWQGEIR